jgi:hypothetical protein
MKLARESWASVRRSRSRPARTTSPRCWMLTGGHGSRESRRVLGECRKRAPRRHTRHAQMGQASSCSAKAANGRPSTRSAPDRPSPPSPPRCGISPGRLVDCTITCAKAVEERARGLLVALLAVGIAVAHADQRCPAPETLKPIRLFAVGTGRPSLSSASTLRMARSSPSHRSRSGRPSADGP